MSNKKFLESIKIFISIVLIVLSVVIFFTTYQEKKARSETSCDIGSFYKDESAPYEYSGNRIVSEVGVKAGTGCDFFKINATSECYQITGLGTTEVLVRQIRSDNVCKGISHVAFFSTQSVNPTSTPTTPAISATPSKTRTPSKTPTRSLTPSEVPNPSESPQPSICPMPSAVTDIKVSCPNCST